MRALIVAAVVGITGAAAVAVWAGGKEDAPPALTVLGVPVDAEMLDQGADLYAENCASCHGADLEGQPDWRRRLDNGRMPAPPHDETGHTWHHADQQLFDITKNGLASVVPGYESDMPVFEGILSDAEITAILGYIKSTWPERERNYQAEITSKNEEGS
ncbi:MAG: cytochrome c [Sulfitobacter sp.]|jgi:mono/diheme cytochrome c family protein|uniref:Cytochrome c, mono-and diheme variants n=1 Tax=Sulfitobacter delicatus TaxID=218672 RepID=A0A1G7VA99_9RHOB|nr:MULTISPECIES: cytochrome c [Sulfitobacter]MBM05264.1 cytochrome C [Sulfitobacter sp.]AYE87222.1 cytochrome C [Sulfitobacter sp. D7]MCZ4368032.1 cytochrome c [Sulfitobacter dubius]UWR29568.1 cytochrome c [Sulfitobacter sp. W002]UWR37090.1 cytochrome c [Sulfitobacter sp. W074]|tara:strand:- start:207 stop:683 length:477 start_codon:yes stop_codon:yes gene_type:complete